MIFLHINHFTGHQTVQDPKDSFSANIKINESFSKSIRSFHLFNQPNDSKKISSFWWTSSNRI